MPDYRGPIQHVELVSTLWLIPLLPFVGALVNAFYSSGLLGQAGAALRAAWTRIVSDDPPVPPLPRKKAPNGTVSTVAVGAMVIAFVLSAWHVAQLLGLPPEQRFLLNHCWRMVRY